MKLNLESERKEIVWANEIADFAKKHGDAAAAEEVKRLVAQFENRKIAVAVVGLNKRGKSTFCNAFLGRKDDHIAPIDWIPATGVISAFSNDSVREDATVVFEDGRQEVIPYERIKDYVLEKNNPENKKQVERVDVFGKFELDDDVILLDFPGDDALHVYHSQIIYQYLPRVDVVLFLSSATDPIQKSELDLLAKVRADDRRKIFFIINKVDECEDNELEEAKSHDAGVLQKAGIEHGDRSLLD